MELSTPVRQLWKSWGHNWKNPELGPYAFVSGFYVLVSFKETGTGSHRWHDSHVFYETDYTGFQPGGLPSAIWSRSSSNDWEMKAHLWAWGTKGENQDTLISCLQNWRPVEGSSSSRSKLGPEPSKILYLLCMDSHFCFMVLILLLINLIRQGPWQVWLSWGGASPGGFRALGV